MTDLTSLIDTSEVTIDTQGTQDTDTARLAASINRLSDILEGGIQINSVVAFNATASDPTDGSEDPITDGSQGSTADGSEDPTPDGSQDSTADGSEDPTPDGSQDSTADGSEDPTPDGSQGSTTNN